MVLAALALAGCATHRDLSDKTVLVNRGIEEGANRALLLNVLRAYKRRPMHFTSVTQVHSPYGIFTPSIAFGIPFGRRTTDAFTASPSAALERPSMDVAVLDGEEFMRGITTPVRAGFIDYLMDQGWPADLLFNLFIRSIELPAGTTLETPLDLQDGRLLVNNPLDVTRHASFQMEMRKLVDCGLYIDSRVESDRLEIDVAPNNTRLRDIVEMRKEGMTLVPKPDADKSTAGIYWLDKPERVPVFYVRRVDNTCKSALVQSEIITTKERAAALQKERDRQQQANSAQNEQTSAATEMTFRQLPQRGYAIARTLQPAASAHKRAPDLPTQIYLRSPEAVIYYLGELARLQLEGSYDNAPAQPPKALVRENREEPIFVVKRGRDALHGAAVSVHYDGDTYSIPPTGRDAGQHRSMNVLTLVTQLIALQKKASEIPTTSTVRAIGR